MESNETPRRTIRDDGDRTVRRRRRRKLADQCDDGRGRVLLIDVGRPGGAVVVGGYSIRKQQAVDNNFLECVAIGSFRLMVWRQLADGEVWTCVYVVWSPTFITTA